MAYYKVTEHPKEDPTVREMQSKLNCIKLQYNCSWPYLQIDGKYGRQTALAVRGFQQYRNITPVSGEMGDTTIRYINEIYSNVPQIYSSQLSGIKQNKASNNPLADVFDVFQNVLSRMREEIKAELKYAYSLGHCDGKAIADHFRKSMGRFDPQMKQLRDAFDKNISANDTLARLKNEVPGKSQKYRSFRESMLAKKNQKEISRCEVKLKHSARTAETVSKDYVNNLKKYDIVTKISNKLKGMGITGEVKLSSHKTLQIKAGGIILQFLSLKDILLDLMQFDDWGKESWKEDLLKDCYNFLDQLIIAIISWVIADCVVVATVTVIGATVSAGTLVVIISVAAIIIGLIIAWLIEIFSKNLDDNISFSKFLWEEAANQLLSAVYTIH